MIVDFGMLIGFWVVVPAVQKSSIGHQQSSIVWWFG
jgi:hypothetical protein